MSKGQTMKRREFLGFFVIGSLASLVAKKLGLKRNEQPKEALYWRRKA